MTTNKKFTVTLPDGSVAKRTSARADYGFAVVLAETAAARVAEAEENAERWERDAEQYRAVLAAGRFATLSRADFERFLGDAETRAAHYREIAEVALGTPTTYHVLRWSRTEALAAKGAKEFSHLERNGSTLTIVPVD